MALHFGMAGGNFRFVRWKGCDDEEIDILEDGMASGIVKPLHTLGQFLGPNRRSPNGSYPALSVDDLDSSATDNNSLDQSGVTHHSPTQVLKNFNEI
ncbi:hypothetical protein TB1_033479 [Malus domestica]